MHVGKRKRSDYDRIMQRVEWAVEMLRDGFALVDVRDYFRPKMTPGEFKVWIYHTESKRRQGGL